MKRTPYIKLVMESTYSQVAINAVLSGTIEGAWEKAIAERLQKDYEGASYMPLVTLTDLNISEAPRTPETWLKAAYLIRATEPETENA